MNLHFTAEGIYIRDQTYNVAPEHGEIPSPNRLGLGLPALFSLLLVTKEPPVHSLRTLMEALHLLGLYDLWFMVYLDLTFVIYTSSLHFRGEQALRVRYFHAPTFRGVVSLLQPWPDLALLSA